MNGIEIKVSHALTFTAEEKTAFTAIMEKSKDVDAWSNASQYVMADAILRAMADVQDNLNKTSIDIAQGILDKKTKAGKPKASAKVRAKAQAVIEAKGVNTARAGFDLANVQTALYGAVSWPSDTPRKSDGQFYRLVDRAGRTSLVIWENGKEYAMQRTALVDDKGEAIVDDKGEAVIELKPVEAAYLAFAGNKKNPGKMMMPNGKLMKATENPDMYEDDGAPKMEPSGWRSIADAYRKLHPGKSGGGNDSRDGDADAMTDAEAYEQLASGTTIPDHIKIATVKTLTILLRKDPAKALVKPGSTAIAGLRNLVTEIAETVRQVDKAKIDADAKESADLNEAAVARAHATK